jgi:hypothetical protein
LRYRERPRAAPVAAGIAGEVWSVTGSGSFHPEVSLRATKGARHRARGFWDRGTSW